MSVRNQENVTSPEIRNVVLLHSSFMVLTGNSILGEGEKWTAQHNCLLIVIQDSLWVL